MAENPVFFRLLGLCPLLAVSSSVLNGLVLGVASLFTIVLSSFLVACCRGVLLQSIRIPIYAIIIASIVSCLEILLATFHPEWQQSIGIFFPLIVTNCAIFSRMEAFARSHAPLEAALDGFATGLGFLVALLAMGGVRQVLIQGLDLQLAIFPAGAFFCLGGIIALLRSRNAR